jgi:hypothetical protein
MGRNGISREETRRQSGLLCGTTKGATAASPVALGARVGVSKLYKRLDQNLNYGNKLLLLNKILSTAQLLLTCVPHSALVLTGVENEEDNATHTAGSYRGIRIGLGHG